MQAKTHGKKLCLFYILVLLLWGAVSSSASVSEIADHVSATDISYVNRLSAAITSAGKTFPAQEYLSERAFGTQETVSAARGRSVRPVTRSVRNVSAALFFGCLILGSFAGSLLFLRHEIPAHSLGGIMITNYIHRQDGQKP